MPSSGRNKRTHFDFTLGESIQQLETRAILLQAAGQISLARMAVKEGSRTQALARLEAASEALAVLRDRDDRLRLW
jgi:hypothetical protein